MLILSFGEFDNEFGNDNEPMSNIRIKDYRYFFLGEYVDLGSNERIQEYDESYCGAYCLYMIYLIDMGFRIKRALDILVNQVKCPDGYKKCQCFGCKAKGKLEVNDNVNDNGNDNENDNDIDIDNGNGNGNCNQGTCLPSHEQSSFSDGKQETHNDDDDKYISIFSERTPSVARQRGTSLASQPNKEINLVHKMVVDVDVEGPLP